MADVTYITRDGDVVDAICFSHYGRTAEVTEAVLAANPGLSDLGPVLDAGVEVTLPDFGTPEAGVKEIETVRLWG